VFDSVVLEALLFWKQGSNFISSPETASQEAVTMDSTRGSVFCF
jgi:hypothetical protein